MTSIITFGDIIQIAAVAYGLGVATPVIGALIYVNWANRKARKEK